MVPSTASNDPSLGCPSPAIVQNVIPAESKGLNEQSFVAESMTTLASVTQMSMSDVSQCPSMSQVTESMPITSISDDVMTETCLDEPSSAFETSLAPSLTLSSPDSPSITSNKTAKTILNPENAKAEITENAASVKSDSMKSSQ